MNLVNGNIDNNTEEMVDINHTFESNMTVVHRGGTGMTRTSSDLIFEQEMLVAA